jgi:hypothetical protein
LNNLKNILQAAPDLTSITSNFTFPQTAGSIAKRLPSPTPQERAKAEQDGHPGRVKREGAAGKPKKRRKLGHLNNLKNIFQVAPALTGITSNFIFLQTAGSIAKRLPPPTPHERAEQRSRTSTRAE